MDVSGLKVIDLNPAREIGLRELLRSKMKRSWSEGIVSNILNLMTYDTLLATQKELTRISLPVWKNLQTPAFTKINISAGEAAFKIYCYLQKRINEVIIRCPNATNDNQLCPDMISIVEQSTHSPFFDKFKTLQPIGNIQSDISVFIGADDNLFDVFRREVIQGTIICRIQSNDRIRKISREEWGFLYNAPDLSNDNLTTHIDDVLERVALEKLARAAKALPKEGKGTEGIITEVKELFTESQVPMPDWLKEREPDRKSQAAQTMLEKISEEVLTLPYVFACGVSNKCIQIMLLRKDESKKEDLIQRLNGFGLSHEEYNIHGAEIKPLSDEKFKSGDRINVRGSINSGTLGGFAKLKTNKDKHPKTVVITARHVINGNDKDNKVLEVNKKILGKVMEMEEEGDKPTLDIAIGEVTAHHSACDTSFRRENGDKGFAEISEVCLSNLVNKRVHLWGVSTSPGVAKISNTESGASIAGDFWLIAMLCNEERAFAKEGDSGAMVLMERHPRCSPNMVAIGTLVGEVVHQKLNDDQSTETEKEKVPENARSSLKENAPDTQSNILTKTDANETLFAVVPLRKGFHQLSKKHGGSLTLFTSTDQQ